MSRMIARTTAPHGLNANGRRDRARSPEWIGPGAWLAKALFTRKARRYLNLDAPTIAGIAERERTPWGASGSS